MGTVASSDTSSSAAPPLSRPIVFPENYSELQERVLQEHDKLFDYTFEDLFHLKDEIQTIKRDSSLSDKEKQAQIDDLIKESEKEFGPIPDAAIDVLFKAAKDAGGFQNAIQVVKHCLKPILDKLEPISLASKEKDLSGKVVLANKLGNSIGSALIFHGYVQIKGESEPRLIVVKGFHKVSNVAEIEFGFRCDHPNVIKPIGVALMNIRFAKMIAQILPLFPYTSLKDYFEKEKIQDLRKKVETFAGVARGLEYLHRNNISHNDLKSDNVFVKADGTPVISDFGNARFLYNLMIKSGTPTTKSPDVQAGALITSKADMFALGRIYEQIMSDFNFEFVLPGSEMRGEVVGCKLYPDPLKLGTEKEVFQKLDLSKDEASEEYKSNFKFLYDVSKNTSTTDTNYFIFVSKYEEECNKNLPRTNLKYMVELFSRDFDFDSFYGRMESDPVYKNLLTLNPRDRWSAREVLIALGDSGFETLGKDLPDDDTLYVKPDDVDRLQSRKPLYRNFAIESVVDLSSRITRTGISPPIFNIFTSIVEEELDVVVKDYAQDVEGGFKKYKDSNFNMLPKYFDWPTFVDSLLEKRYPEIKKDEQRTEQRNKLLWLKNYFENTTNPSSGSASTSSSSSFNKIFNQFC